MIKIGLTGGIGSGKSLVARVFAHFGVPVYGADTEAKKFLHHSVIIQNLVERFGNSIIDDNNRIIKSKLAEIVFNDKEALNFLNKLIHPLVINDFDVWCKEQLHAPYIIHEAALIIEHGFQHYFDKIILITAPETIKIKRVMQRDKVSEEHVKQRMLNQLKDDEKIPFADYIINNDDSQLILPQILNLHQLFLDFSKLKPYTN